MSLLDLLRDAHQRAARDNPNLSSQLVVAMAQAGAPFEKAVGAALLSLGTLHAPVTQARRVLRRAQEYPGCIEDAVVGRKLVPGFGNSFYREDIDPAFLDLHAALPVWGGWREVLIEGCKRTERWPNAAAYTAIVAEIEGVPEGTELRLVIEARLPVWAELWSKHRPRKEMVEG